MSAASLMPVMLIIMPVVALIMMSSMFSMLFVVPVLNRPLPFHINHAVPLNIVGTAGVDTDVNAGRCRHIALDADIHTGAGQPGGDEYAGQSGQSGFGIGEDEGEEECGH